MGNRLAFGGLAIMPPANSRADPCPATLARASWFHIPCRISSCLPPTLPFASYPTSTDQDRRLAS
jgi:hypothetical protein